MGFQSKIVGAAPWPEDYDEEEKKQVAVLIELWLFDNGMFFFLLIELENLKKKKN